jgi:hypothetical protein
MTTAKAVSVATALVNAGFSFTAVQRGPNDWVIASDADSVNVPIATVNTFVTNQGVIGLVQHVEYS